MSEYLALKKIKDCKPIMKELYRASLQIAFDGLDAKVGGTYRTLMRLAEISLEGDKIKDWAQRVQRVLSAVRRGYRALLVAVYVRKISVGKLTKKYHVPKREIYSKLCKARKDFETARQALEIDLEFPKINFDLCLPLYPKDKQP